jgi:hypothetical protein
MPAIATGNPLPVSKKAASAPINVSFNSLLIRNLPVPFRPIACATRDAAGCAAAHYSQIR